MQMRKLGTVEGSLDSGEHLLEFFSRWLMTTIPIRRFHWTTFWVTLSRKSTTNTANHLLLLLMNRAEAVALKL
jgi:hypothetical protein